MQLTIIGGCIALRRAVPEVSAPRTERRDAPPCAEAPCAASAQPIHTLASRTAVPSPYPYTGATQCARGLRGRPAHPGSPREQRERELRSTVRSEARPAVIVRSRNVSRELATPRCSRPSVNNLSARGSPGRNARRALASRAGRHPQSREPSRSCVPRLRQGVSWYPQRVSPWCRCAARVSARFAPGAADTDVHDEGTHRGHAWQRR